jgi:hypothetical protein
LKVFETGGFMNLENFSLKPTANDETLPNLHKNKAPKKGTEKKNEDQQSPGKQTAQKRQATRR